MRYLIVSYQMRILLPLPLTLHSFPLDTPQMMTMVHISPTQHLGWPWCPFCTKTQNKLCGVCKSSQGKDKTSTILHNPCLILTSFLTDVLLISMYMQFFLIAKLMKSFASLRVLKKYTFLLSPKVKFSKCFIAIYNDVLPRRENCYYENTTVIALQNWCVVEERLLTQRLENSKFKTYLPNLQDTFPWALYFLILTNLPPSLSEIMLIS